MTALSVPHVGGLKKNVRRSSRTVCDGSYRDAGVETGWRDRQHTQQSHERVKQAARVCHTLGEEMISPACLLPERYAADKLSLKPNSSANRARQSLGKCLGNQPPLIPHSWSAHSLAPLGGC